MASKILDESTFNELKNLYEKLKNSNINNKVDLDELTTNDGESTSNSTTQSNFEHLLEKLEYLLEKCEKSSTDYIKLIAMKASLIYEQAKSKLFYDTGKEAFEMLQGTLEFINEFSNHEYVLFLYLRIVNHLSYLMSKNDKLEEARRLLEDILYKEYNTHIAVYSTEDLFSSNDILHQSTTDMAKFNKLMLNNIQMLGWIYGKLGFHDLHAFMEHLYLQKQLDVEDMSVLQWTSKCCRLATIYLTTNNWIYARYYLSSIGALLNEKAGDLKSIREFPQAKADLSKAWIHYGLHLFCASRKKLLVEMYDNENSQKDEDLKPPFEVLEQHKFKGLNVNIPNIPANFITETQEARTLFVHTQNWLKQTRIFYTLKDYPLQYVNAVLDLSELYRFLAFYETELDSQYNVQKRRSETLEALSTLLREVRPNCYTAVSIELWRELAEVQIELMGINLKRLYSYENEHEGPESIQKRVDAIANVHDKLEAIGDTLGTPTEQVSEAHRSQQDINNEVEAESEEK